MTNEEASALVQFIKDHDTRYQATAMADDGECYVLLTRPEDGTRLDPVYTVEEYGEQHIDRMDSSPTIRDAWERWFAALRGDGEDPDQPAP